MLETIRAHLTHAIDPAAGEALYDSMTADAPIWDDGEITRRDAIGRDAFARRFEVVSRFHLEHHPQRLFAPDTARLTLEAVHEEGDEAVVWCTVPAAGRAHPVDLAAGLRREEGAWKLVWTTLAPARADWSFQLGLAQTLADYAYAQAGLLGAPRTWLDASFYRLWGHERPPLRLTEGARFSCHSSGACCHVSFKIDLPPSAQALIDAIPWETVAPDLQDTRLPVREDGKLTLKAQGERCRFLDENRHCLIHKALGRAAFTPCAVFPFTFKPAPDAVAVGLSQFCGSARAGLGPLLTEREDDLYARLAMLYVGPAEALRIRETPVTPEAFEAAWDQLGAFLDRADLPIERRLWLGARYMHSLAQEQPPEAEVWASERIEPLPDAFRAQVEEMLGAVVAVVMNMPDQSQPRAIPGQGHPLDMEKAHRMIRELHHGRSLAHRLSLTAAHHLAVLLYLLVRHLEAHLGGPLTEELWARIAARFFHGGMTNFLEMDEKMGRPLHDLLNVPGMGLWLLGYLAETPSAAEEMRA